MEIKKQIHIIYVNRYAWESTKTKYTTHGWDVNKAELTVHQKCRSHDYNLFSESEWKNPVNPISSRRAHIPINT